jgi:DNA-binding NarL/FixJ family response regulator
MAVLTTGRAAARSAQADMLSTLSSREREILALVSGGMSNLAIADRLTLTERTVESHMARIFAKLRLAPDPLENRRVQAALIYALAVPPP